MLEGIVNVRPPRVPSFERGSLVKETENDVVGKTLYHSCDREHSKYFKTHEIMSMHFNHFTSK